MCRIALYSGVTDYSALARTLDDLEWSLGGDGNGYWTDQRPDEVIKGKNVASSLIAALSVAEPGLHLFHTRLATVGGTRDQLTHPFRCDGAGMLVHNGGFYDWDLYEDCDPALSDTEGAAMLIEQYGERLLFGPVFHDSGVWVLTNRPETSMPLVVHRGQHEIYMCYLRDSASSERMSDGRQPWMLTSEKPMRGGLPIQSAHRLKAGHAYEILPETGTFMDISEHVAPTYIEKSYERRAPAIPYSYGYGSSYGSYSPSTSWYEHEYGEPYGSGPEEYAAGEGVIVADGSAYVLCEDCGEWDRVDPESSYVDAGRYGGYMCWLCEEEMRKAFGVENGVESGFEDEVLERMEE